MIISHKHKFIFIKVPKTAGTSIEIELSKLCGERDIITKERTADVEKLTTKTPRNYRGLFNPIPDFRHYGLKNLPKNTARFLMGWKYYDHIPASIVKARVGERVWDSYFKFCFERNPWDKLVSAFCWQKRLPGREQNFERFVKAGLFPKGFPLYTLNGSLAMDYVGRFENLESDLKTAYEKIGLSEGRVVLPKTKSHTRKDSEGYRQYYTQELRDIVASAFGEEIKLMGYSF